MAEQPVERERRITSELKATVSGPRHVNRNVLKQQFNTVSSSNSMSRQTEQPAEMRRITSEVMRIAEPHGFFECGVHPPTPTSMAAWAYSADTDEFTLEIQRDRGGGIGIYLGSKVRRAPLAHMRGPWSLSHLRGYLNGDADHFIFVDPDHQICWLQDNMQFLLDTSFLNSDDLNNWAVKASRRLFGQDPR